MKQALLVMLLGLSMNSIAADDCKHFNKGIFSGFYEVSEYVCEGERQNGFSCYSEEDTYKNISKVVITTVPLQIELGLKVDLFSHVDPTWPELIDQYILSSHSRYNKSVLMCAETIENGETVYEIKSKTSSGSSTFYTKITKVNELVVIEVFGSVNDVTSLKKLILKNE